MKRSWLFTGFVAYILLTAVIFPFVIGVPVNLMFGSDAGDYSRGAANLLRHGLYSLDGVQPFFGREPGMSFFLLPIYGFFGIENAMAFSLIQAALLFLAVWYFCNQVSRLTGARAAGICFLLLLTSGSVLHTVFSAYRECLALSVLLLFSGLFLSSGVSRRWWKTVLLGLLFGFLILTYYPFIFFPPVLLFVWWVRKMPLRDAAIIIAICYTSVGLWAYRNYVQHGKFSVINDHRTGVMWYVRGEQAEKVHGAEPFWCLWAEYVSRDWTGRSPACSFNAVMHEKWPKTEGVTIEYGSAKKEGQQKIKANFPSYLWFSAVDTIELHLPFLGGGWSHAYNVYASITMLLLYIGFFFGIPALFRREYALWFLLMAYNTTIFILTDATPRYLVPVLFCYALFAGVGYDWLASKISKRLKISA